MSPFPLISWRAAAFVLQPSDGWEEVCPDASVAGEEQLHGEKYKLAARLRPKNDEGDVGRASVRLKRRCTCKQALKMSGTPPF